ncbi:MAG: c-type cytochrome [Pseudomonadota bacterium]
MNGSAKLGTILFLCLGAGGAWAAPTDVVKRGEYLVQSIGCADCHAPKLSGMQPNPALSLSGHPEKAKLPPKPGNSDPWILSTGDLTAWVGPWGTSFASNLTPDKDTGLGQWTAEEFIKTMRNGKRRGMGRPLLPPMPWFNYAKLTDDDLQAIFAYLQTLKPIRNRVPAPLPPAQQR